MMKRLSYIMLTALMVSSASVSAGVVMGGTRIVYPQHSKEVAYSVSNMEVRFPILFSRGLKVMGRIKITLRHLLLHHLCSDLIRSRPTRCVFNIPALRCPQIVNLYSGSILKRLRQSQKRAATNYKLTLNRNLKFSTARTTLKGTLPLPGRK